MRVKQPIALLIAAALASACAALPAAAQQAVPVAGGPQSVGGGKDAEPRHRLTLEDRAAFAEARLAAVHAGLKLTAEQEKLWPAVQKAVEDMREAAEKLYGSSAPPQKGDLIGRLKRMAERSKLRGEALIKLAEAAEPLYASLNEDQKWRLQVLIRAIHHRHMAMMTEQFRDGEQGKHAEQDEP